MAIETLRPPVYSARVINDLALKQMTPEWYRPLANLFQRVFGLSQVTAVSTSDVTAAAAITQDPITSANAAAQTGAYVQADVQSIATLANELKTDVNILTDQLQDTRTQLNLAIALVNELKAAHNAQVTALNP